MDFLNQSLNLSTLPECQTRITDAVSKVLELDPSIRLGVAEENDMNGVACTTCGKALSANTKVVCKACRRVYYCSRECRRSDSCNLNGDDSQGHSATVCNLLRLCHIDEKVEEALLLDKSSSKKPPVINKSITKEEREASDHRISSEFESYPATLSNIIMNAPCFIPILEKFTHSLKHQKQMEHHEKHSLTIHIIGASEEAELWRDYDAKQFTGCDDVYDGYLSAFSDLASTLKELRKIHLIFVGPNCKCKEKYVERTFDEDYSDFDGDNNGRKRKRQHDQCKLIIEAYDSAYDTNFLSSSSNLAETGKIQKHSRKISISKPDVAVFFNPGFTCPDYSWLEALDSCKKFSGIPFFVTTNTEMEAMADMQYLHQKGYIDSLPRSVSDIISDGIGDHDIDSIEYSNEVMFFGENPNAGLRVRQSGNMANDLFVKNRWVFGGTFASSSTIDRETIKTSGKATKESKASQITASKDKSIGKKKKKNSALM